MYSLLILCIVLLGIMVCVGFVRLLQGNMDYIWRVIGAALLMDIITYLAIKAL